MFCVCTFRRIAMINLAARRRKLFRLLAHSDGKSFFRFDAFLLLADFLRDFHRIKMQLFVLFLSKKFEIYAKWLSHIPQNFLVFA